MLHYIFRDPASRAKRRENRQARWNKPLQSSWQTYLAWQNMLFVDHAILRLLYWNFHKVHPELYRSAQPTPYQIKQAKDKGIKTIINLRGGREYGSWPLEVAAIEKHGLKLETITARSREAPSKDLIYEARDLFARIDYPALLHCKSGADRAGFMAGLWLVLQDNATPQTALKQLSLKYGHFKSARTGILDAFFLQWAQDRQEKPVDFLQWVEEIYNPDTLQSNFKTNRLSNFIVDKVLVHE